jgi:hypothetical protein
MKSGIKRNDNISDVLNGICIKSLKYAKIVVSPAFPEDKIIKIEDKQLITVAEKKVLLFLFGFL